MSGKEKLNSITVQMTLAEVSVVNRSLEFALRNIKDLGLSNNEVSNLNWIGERIFKLWQETVEKRGKTE